MIKQYIPDVQSVISTAEKYSINIVAKFFREKTNHLLNKLYSENCHRYIIDWIVLLFETKNRLLKRNECYIITLFA